MAPKRRRASKLRRHSAPGISVFAVRGIPEIEPGTDLAREILAGLKRSRTTTRDGDIFVVAQKVISKTEGQLVDLRRVHASKKAAEIAAKQGSDPRVVEVVLRQAQRIVRESQRVLIVETQHGFVCANGGVDHSNIPGDSIVSLLPKDPDASARRLAKRLRRLTEKTVGVIVSDTFGRPWRLGLTNVAIGAFGAPVLRDLRGQHDRTGNPLRATILAVADELAAAAGLLMEKAEGLPVVVIRGYRHKAAGQTAKEIIRPGREDLFR